MERVLGNKDLSKGSKPSKFQEKLEFAQGESAANLPGPQAQHRALARGKEPTGLFGNHVPAVAVTRDEKQHKAPSQGSTSSPRASWSTACRGPGTATALESADG